MQAINTTRRNLLLALGGGAALLGAAHAAWPRLSEALGQMPPLDGATGWINTPALTREALRGRVVLVNFWTFSCSNSLRPLPHVKAWAEKYGDHGLTVLGVHTPEFRFERECVNVERAVRELGIHYPVAMDSNSQIWSAFGTQAWPTFLVIDATGRIRHAQAGEGQFDFTEQQIQQWLTEAGQSGWQGGTVNPMGEGTQAATDYTRRVSPETYIGSARASRFVRSDERNPAATPMLSPEQWTATGAWQAEPEYLQLAQPGGRILHRFHARDLHLVLSPAQAGQTVNFRVRIDGQAPGADHGTDITPDGMGRADAPRLYQLVRQSQAVTGYRLFEIEFLDAGIQAYSFTFG